LFSVFLAPAFARGFVVAATAFEAFACLSIMITVEPFVAWLLGEEIFLRLGLSVEIGAFDCGESIGKK